MFSACPPLLCTAYASTFTSTSLTSLFFIAGSLDNYLAVGDHPALDTGARHHCNHVVWTRSVETCLSFTLVACWFLYTPERFTGVVWTCYIFLFSQDMWLSVAGEVSLHGATLIAPCDLALWWLMFVCDVWLLDLHCVLFFAYFYVVVFGKCERCSVTNVGFTTSLSLMVSQRMLFKSNNAKTSVRPLHQFFERLSVHIDRITSSHHQWWPATKYRLARKCG